MTKQKAFDIAVKRMRDQQYIGSESNESCLYRGPNGRVCAIGALLPDNEYREVYDGSTYSPTDIPFIYELISFKTTSDCSKFWTNFQKNLHDSNVGGKPETWEQNFEAFAKHYNLRYKVPK